jgi:hypothetical protein
MLEKVVFKILFLNNNKLFYIFRMSLFLSFKMTFEPGLQLLQISKK